MPDLVPLFCTLVGEASCQADVSGMLHRLADRGGATIGFIPVLRSKTRTECEQRMTLGRELRHHESRDTSTSTS